MPPRSHAVAILQLFALTLMVIPSNTVIGAIGANGYPAALVGMFAFAAFIAATLLGFHNPLQHRHPVRSVLCLLWLAVLASYVAIDRRTLSVAELASADRLLMQLAIISGVVLLAAECLHSLQDLRRVLRVLVWGGAFCGAVAALQFKLGIDIAAYLREIPGFSPDLTNSVILDRGGFNRVTGTAVYPIELGVVAGMLLPLAIYLAIWDVGMSMRARWAPVVLIAIAIPASVSRSAVLSVASALAVLLVLMPARQRVVGICCLPFALAGLFMSAPGLIGTLASYFGAGTSDSSITARLADFPLVERFLREAPWFGRGGGTYIPEPGLDVLDNQFLKTAIELGGFGVIAFIAYLLVPVIAALVARHHSLDPELRLLFAALAGSALAATITSVTFDSMWYPMFYGVHALVLGMIGAGWRLVAQHETVAATPIRGRSLVGTLNPTAHIPGS